MVVCIPFGAFPPCRTTLIPTDVEDVKFVINFDYPNNSEDYIHRIGRTARSQKTGTAYTFFTPNNFKQAHDLVSVLREANQAINPKLIQMAEDRGGRSRGGRGGFRDDRRDRYSGGRRDYNYSQDGRSNDRSYDNGPKKVYNSKTPNGGAYGNGASNYNGSGNNGFNGSYNGQSNFNGSQAGGFGNQAFQNKQFDSNQGSSVPFNPQQPPMMPYSMPPPNF